MRKLLMSSLFIFLFIAGCGTDESYNNAIQRGLDYIASEEYKKAEGSFEIALDEKKNDEKARALLDQTVYYQDSVGAMDEADFELAKESSEKVIGLESGSAALIKKAEDLISSVNELEVKLTDVTKDYEKASKIYKENKYDEANKIVENILEIDLEHSIFKSINSDVELLQNEIEAAIKAEIEDEEKIAKEKTERETEQEETNQTKKESKPNDFSMQSAAQIAENKYGNDGDTGYNVLDGPGNENGKKYYTVQLYSIEMQDAGGSGTLFTVKVFEDGTVLEE